MSLNTYKTLPLLPREPFSLTADMSPAWRLYFEQLQQVLGNASGLDWQVIDKSQARLEDVGIRPHSALQEIQGEGDLHVSQNQIDAWNSLSGDDGDDQLLSWIR